MKINLKILFNIFVILIVLRFLIVRLNASELSSVVNQNLTKEEKTCDSSDVNYLATTMKLVVLHEDRFFLSKNILDFFAKKMIIARDSSYPGKVSFTAPNISVSNCFFQDTLNVCGSFLAKNCIFNFDLIISNDSKINVPVLIIGKSIINKNIIFKGVAGEVIISDDTSFTGKIINGDLISYSKL